MTIHIEADKKDIADVVLMPGDPLRAKYIAENFLENYKLVNKVRNMYGYTGYYKNKKVTVFASGMGIPSIGIYSYELYKFYDVKKIIRIGTCGTISKDIKLTDVILGTTAYSESSFGTVINQKEEKVLEASKNLCEKIITTAINKNTKLKVGTIYTSDVFDVYFNIDHILENKNFLVSEMEAYGLYFIANKLNKEAATLVTVVDSKYEKKNLTSEERQNTLNEMILLALDSIID